MKTLRLIEQVRLMLAVDTIKPQDSRQQIFGGAEVAFYDLLFLRAGYKFKASLPSHEYASYQVLSIA